MIETFRIRRDTAANWTTANPILGLGEPGLETDTRRVKYGDDVTAWNTLPYSSASVAWGQITGTLANQTDLKTALDGKQPLDAELTALAGLTSAADRVPYFTGLETAALAVLTAFGRSLIAAADAAAARLALGLGTAATANTGTSGATIPLLNGANTWSAIQTFGARIVGALGAGSVGLDMATNDNYVSLRVIQNAKSGGDGLYVGYNNANSGVTRLYGGSSDIRIEIRPSYVLIPGLTNAASDSAAAAAGVPVNGLYRNGSALMIRVA